MFIVAAVTPAPVVAECWEQTSGWAPVEKGKVTFSPQLQPKYPQWCRRGTRVRRLRKIRCNTWCDCGSFLSVAGINLGSDEAQSCFNSFSSLVCWFIRGQNLILFQISLWTSVSRRSGLEVWDGGTTERSCLVYTSHLVKNNRVYRNFQQSSRLNQAVSSHFCLWVAAEMQNQIQRNGNKSILD